jgi:hypothetical protein
LATKTERQLSLTRRKDKKRAVISQAIYPAQRTGMWDVQDKMWRTLLTKLLK